jgi:hypothetical protein
VISILCPPPINIQICSNTFVKFRYGLREVVGLVLTVSPPQEVVSIRLFLSWEDVKERVAGNNAFGDISFWPKDDPLPPYYLCDTDLVVNDVGTRLFCIGNTYQQDMPEVNIHHFHLQSGSAQKKRQ